MTARREQPSTYTVQDRSNRDELTRLQIQDRLVTTSMGGVLPEQANPAALRRVLDVGCGTGGWLIEVAKTYPNIQLLVGADVNLTFVEYARAQAKAEQVSERVEFHVMDALRMLEFPNHYFDLVNQRFAISWLRTWDWRDLLREYRRVTRPGGMVRVTESDMAIDESSSPALSRLSALFLEALYQAGHIFTPEKDGVLRRLPGLLCQHGIQDVQTRAYRLEYRAGTPAGEQFVEDLMRGFRTTRPFMRKWTRVPEDYDDLYQQMLHEMQQPGFVAPCNLLTLWGSASLEPYERADIPR